MMTWGVFPMEFSKVVGTTKSVAEAVAAIEAALPARKFAVLWQMDMNKTLEGKGLSLAHEVRILEVCSAPRAKEAVETNPEVAFFLPCKIVVKRVDGETTIGLARPTLLIDLVGDSRLMGMATEVEAALMEAIEEAR